MSHRIQLLWFSGCPNHVEARRLLAGAIARLLPGGAIEEVDASDPDVATALRFAGSPTIRVDGVDVEPGFVDPGDYTPRCRLYWTSAGLRGVPDMAWIEAALRA